jgi:ribosome-associated protein
MQRAVATASSVACAASARGGVSLATTSSLLSSCRLLTFPSVRNHQLRALHASAALSARARGGRTSFAPAADGADATDAGAEGADAATTTVTGGRGRGRRGGGASTTTRVRSLDDETLGDDELVAISKDDARKLGLVEEEADPASSPTPTPTPTTAGPLPDSPDRPDIVRSSKYIGVLKEGKEAVLWEAVIVVNGQEISGGEYETELEAAKAYDALARMYVGAEAVTNVPLDPYKAWLPPDAVATTGQIVTKVGVPLTAEEIVEALRQERGVDVRVVALAGRSNLADALVFATGRSVPHMRKMADMVSRALRKRRLPGVDATVEARDMDDWMLVDCGNVIVSVMDADAREVFDLERFWEGMVEGKDPYEGMTYEQWLEKNPIPDKWLQRLERDERELEERRRMSAPPPQDGLGDRPGTVLASGGNRGKSSYNFAGKMVKGGAGKWR